VSSILNKERFNALAEKWDSKPARVEGAMIFVDRILEHINKDIKSFDILDYGCGSGLVSFGFADKVNSILGLDNSESMVEVYNNKAQMINLDNVQSKLHDINKEELPSEKFDLVATNMTMHHIKDIKMFVEKLSSSLRKDGHLFIADLFSEDGKFHSDNTGVEHFGFDTGHLISIFEEAGLKNISCEVLNNIEKPHNSYEVFIIKGMK
jgi:2-polyprenyl-3-methyl-5-hydroxy-6-metoxy-1,4-benzoquinol methylase